ncbi:hypothetical protein NC653_014655 [Populus alba x Populus x berolinensis]|uniref:Uncharacterized protein n=1 Tax=Populus alba x Populus x berolinensis TaxID=444605 RepID=A0AAD6W465_9ROSI|nr:hypothetical protein NC653_014655 [Populus alba x Populus x berolinensis]
MEKLVTSIGSLRQSEDVCEVESESSKVRGQPHQNLSLRQRCRDCWKLGRNWDLGILRTCRCWQLPLETRWIESWTINGMMPNSSNFTDDSR